MLGHLLSSLWGQHGSSCSELGDSQLWEGPALQREPFSQGPHTQTRFPLGSQVALGDTWVSLQSYQASSPEQLGPGQESGFSHGPVSRRQIALLNVLQMGGLGRRVTSQKAQGHLPFQT